MIPRKSSLRLFLLAFTAISLGAFNGCARKEKVLEVDAPGFNLDVEKSTDGSEITIDTHNDNSGTSIDVDTTTKDGDGVGIEVDRNE